MGANWVSFIKIKIIKSLTFLFLHKIYGKGENPIYKMAIRHGLKTVPNEKENLAFFGDNCIIDKSVGNQVYFEFEDLKSKLLEYAGIFYVLYLIALPNMIYNRSKNKAWPSRSINKIRIKSLGVEKRHTFKSCSRVL